jgi:CubicO group peptidase (beta-lactamase class C family)
MAMSRTRIAALLTACIALSSATPISSQSAPPAWRTGVDKVFATWDTRDSPGCALGIYKDGAILYERGYGMADLEHDVPISPDTPFYIGSVSKQFTAFAAALAIQQGKLGADDSIRKYLPELPEYANAITVRQLVHHTSGFRDFYTLLSIAGRRQDELYDNLAVLRLTARQKALNFAPGSDYLYSNTGYALLALSVGRATGTSFGAFVDANIFAPLGMPSSHVHDDDARLVKGRAYGYSRVGGTLRLDTPAGERVGAGGVFSTIRDLLKWDENFYTARVGGRALIEQVQTAGRLSDGRPLTYAWGLQVGGYRGQPIVEHGGSLGGYRAHLMRFPDRHVSVACLCNLGSIAPGTLARRVADIVIGDAFTIAASAPAAAQGAPAAAGGRGAAPGTASGAAAPAAGSSPSAAYAGKYYSDEIETTFTVMIKDGRLMVQRETDSAPVVVQPAAGAGDEYRFSGMTLRFERAADGAPGAIVVDAGRVVGIRFVRR